jgi:phage host-nuclease inhibitor protein Gam
MRVKKKTFKNVTREQAEEAAQQFASSHNKLQTIEAKMNDEITKIRNKYQEEITELKEEMEEPVELLETFAEEKKPDWGKKKSFDLLHCVIGYRTGTPKVTKKKSFSWDAVLQLLKKQSVFDAFIRKTEEVNKEAILAEKDDKLLKKLKDDCFIEVVQEESFYVDAKKEEVIAA